MKVVTDYDIESFYDVLYIINIDIENLIYVLELLKNYNFNYNEKHFIDDCLNMLKFLKDYSSNFECDFLLDSEERN